jgi:hypothetical protein
LYPIILGIDFLEGAGASMSMRKRKKRPKETILPREN